MRHGVAIGFENKKQVQYQPYQSQRQHTAKNEFLKAITELGRGVETINEEDAKGRLQQKLQLQQKLVDDEKNFVAAAAKVVTYKQLLQLQNIAKDFNRYFYERQRGNQ